MRLVWDQVGEREFQSGVDHGVLYLSDGSGIAWNGLTGVEESTDSEIKPYYLDGVKYLQVFTPGDFSGKLTAFMYPDEFDSVTGIADFNPGLAYYDQPPKSFSLAYRTRLGDDVDSESGYKIHILYNLYANPDTKKFGTLADNVEPVEFSWALSGTPDRIPGYRPTVHISIDSTKTPPDLLAILEDILYGTATVDPRLPSIKDMAEYFGYRGALIIVDHLDGSWSAVDEADTYVTMLDDTTFEIVDADATYLDPDTYTISSTNVGGEN